MDTFKYVCLALLLGFLIGLSLGEWHATQVHRAWKKEYTALGITWTRAYRQSNREWAKMYDALLGDYIDATKAEAGGGGEE